MTPSLKKTAGKLYSFGATTRPMPYHKVGQDKLGVASYRIVKQSGKILKSESCHGKCEKRVPTVLCNVTSCDTAPQLPM